MAFDKFVRNLEVQRPNLQLAHHYMFAGQSAPMANRLVELAVIPGPRAKWSVGLGNFGTTAELIETGFKKAIFVNQTVSLDFSHQAVSSNSTCAVHRPSVLTQSIEWQPVIKFYKSKWGEPIVPVDHRDQFSNGVIGYIGNLPSIV